MFFNIIKISRESITVKSKKIITQICPKMTCYLFSGLKNITVS